MSPTVVLYWPMSPTVVLLTVDLLLIAACSLKFVDGAWFPLAVGVVAFVLMATGSRGSGLLLASIKAETPATRPFIAWLAAEEVPRAGRTAVYAVVDVDTAPRPLISNLKHNRVQVARVGDGRTRVFWEDTRGRFRAAGRLDLPLALSESVVPCSPLPCLFQAGEICVCRSLTRLTPLSRTWTRREPQLMNRSVLVVL